MGCGDADAGRGHVADASNAAEAQARELRHHRVAQTLGERGRARGDAAARVSAGAARE